MTQEPTIPTPTPLMSVPNISEGRDTPILDAVGRAFTGAGARLLDRHADLDHHRAVFTLAGEPGRLSAALLEGARVAVEKIDLRNPRGVHPHVGAIDVVPLVYIDPSMRGPAVAEALVTAELISDQLDLPVFLYGEMAAVGRTRAEIRRGGLVELTRRIADGRLRPDFGPRAVHPSAGAVLVGARPVLVAFNLELAPPTTFEEARKIAGLVRDGGPKGLPGVRAIAIELDSRAGQIQISCNVEDTRAVPLARLIFAILEYASIDAGELVGLAPQHAFDGFPWELAMPGFDPARHILENALSQPVDPPPGDGVAPPADSPPTI
ncbi:MAG: glutamate formiminotransferase / 5-formyltetrahydrofolate cyclo-ligase [Solirubrobacteraceae bacterium]|jgi:glutamate formiminotransferase/glutamate formiminotransferase/formiminotetrahydrofolate cyclodeaminase|nr:glutamate formiminotransferase / 5-formyltetrahydrofolate cyclo-ligase [Solirubrobacteraceae bacterium]